MKRLKVIVSIIVSIAVLYNPLIASAALYKKGMESNDILKMQNDLKALGFFDVEATGYYGDITFASVYDFQKANNLYVDGIAGDETLQKISQLLKQETVDENRGKDLLYEGMTSEVVRLYQMKLAYLGLLDCEATGYYGILTKSAVMDFQSGFGIDSDGIITEETASLINRVVTGKVEQLTRYGALTVKDENLAVTALQTILSCMGYYHYEITGYYGDITKRAVIAFQSEYGLYVDGVAGEKTLQLLAKIMSDEGVVVNNTLYNIDLMMNWFTDVQYFFKKGDTAMVYDIWTGKTFYIMRTFGYNHADCETLTATDTAIMKSVYNNQFSWDRRPVLVYVNGTIIAASMAGMPHAGRDDMPKDAWVDNRSQNYGTGYNLDQIKGNNMDGVFDLHFYMSRTHCTNQVESRHQNAILEAYEYGVNNLY